MQFIGMKINGRRGIQFQLDYGNSYQVIIYFFKMDHKFRGKAIQIIK